MTLGHLPPFRAYGILTIDTDQHEPGTHCNSYGPRVQINEDDQASRYPTNATFDTSNEPKRCLQDELFAALTPTQQETHGFFAEGQLSKILTEERVQQELTTHFEDSLPESTIAEYAKTICQKSLTLDESSDQLEQPKTRSYIKILAILILIQKTRAIIKVLEDPSGVNDSDLPLIKSPRADNERFYELRIGRQSETSLGCFQKKWWDQFNIRNFDEWQWTTIPLVFKGSKSHKDVTHHVLQRQAILPFIEDTRTEHEGGFARVFKVAIHPKHHPFHTKLSKSNATHFAVKSLHSQDKAAFKKEVEILNKFSSNKHPHLISLLATYEHVDRFFLLFNWAEADLQTYWKRENPTPAIDMVTVMWLVRQCKGLAHGITKIHEHITTYQKESAHFLGSQNVVFGHHGDIKPENVLWFAALGQKDCKVAGTFKLSDFGLADFSIHQTISMTERSKWSATLGYRAPETDFNPKAAIGRSYDIWTLGCLYLETITWMLGGCTLLEKFLQDRKSSDPIWNYNKTSTFFELEIDNGKMKADIKPTVKRVSQHSPSKISMNLLI